MNANTSIENLLEKNTSALGDFIHKTNSKMVETASRLLDVEQKIARRPGGDGPIYSDGRMGGSLGQDVLNSAGYEQLRDGHTKSFRLKLDRPMFEVKAAILNSGSVLSQATRVPNYVNPSERKLTIRDLLSVSPIDGNSVEFTRENVFTNAAGPQTTEGAIKPESGITFSLVNVPVVTIAHWIPASRQVIADAPLLLDFIDRRLRFGLMIEEEQELLTGASGSGEVSGMLTSGNFTPYNRGASADTRIDTLRKSITQLELADHTASGFVLNPSDWEAISLLKDSQSRYLTGNPVDGNANTLWGLPVVSTPSITQGTFLTGDFKNSAQLFQRQEVVVEIGTQHADFFVRNMVAILCEERIALAIYRPLGLVSGSL